MLSLVSSDATMSSLLLGKVIVIHYCSGLELVRLGLLRLGSVKLAFQLG